jgi:hypothetical protein
MKSEKRKRDKRQGKTENAENKRKKIEKGKEK